MIYRDEAIHISKNAFLDLYVIGYKSMGESIVLNLDNQFIGIVDSYKTVSSFITKQILDKLERNVDFICWTHTDEDHTKGLSELLESNFITENTRLFLPEGITKKEIKSYLEMDSEKEYTKVFKMLNNSSNLNVESANENTLLYSFPLIQGDKQFSFYLESFAPLSQIVRNLELASIKHLFDSDNLSLHQNPNFFSVGLKLTITSQGFAPFTVCLAGDVDNHTIESMKDKNKSRIFSENVILKIPHHCSKNSDLLIKEGLIKNFDFAVTTGYKRGRSNLPDKYVLDEYKKIAARNAGKLSSTALRVNHDFGVVFYRLKLSHLTRKVRVRNLGNASLV
ncbi:MBL fold metallo-hydrolase [Fictibacillus nanhaiensis]|uniref:MBL fold metallo-hydrolase n=1 Tax=Fictibacillus nanhaiensis TaxID=742169 RepID=UPI002E23518E|nr:MBL fold metallo-hydrolase [Fictibacillus nanhaiensis]